MKERYRKFIVLCIVVLSLLMPSCVYIRMTHLDDEDVRWIENFNKYSTCCFTSNRGTHSQLFVKDYGIANSRNPFYFSSNTSLDYEAIASVMFEILQNDRLLEGFFGFRKILPEKYLVLYAGLGDRDADDSLERDIKGFEYAGKLFKECVILDSLNSYISRTSSYPFKSDVKEMVVSKEYGLIYYSFSDGEEFFRDFE